MRIETHCHSYHSFDCNSSIVSILERCKERCVDGIVICDHDVYGITPEEEQLFKENNVTLLKAIEFTTQTDAHIIGISPDIKQIEKVRYHYSIGELIGELKRIGATIIIPHPYHNTGIIGNGKIAKDEIDLAFQSANFIEFENYRYGRVKSDIRKDYPHLIYVIGSDAHASKNVGSFLNEVDGQTNTECLDSLRNHSITFIRNDKHTWRYWVWKKIKRTKLYQTAISIFPEDIRRNIKNTFINR